MGDHDPYSDPLRALAGSSGRDDKKGGPAILISTLQATGVDQQRSVKSLGARRAQRDSFGVQLRTGSSLLAQDHIT
jgi:hypothetical protein